MNHSKRELWRKRLQDYQESGLSGAKWCKKNGIPEHQFWYWKKKEAALSDRKTEMDTWVPLSVEETASSSSAPALTVRIGSAEIEVRPGYDAQLLQEVVRTLMALC